MPRKKPPVRSPRVVWRIADDMPAGEYVHVESSPRAVGPKNPSEGGCVGWAESSFDLLHGTDVTDNPDTLTPELLDDLFGCVEGWAATQPADG
jgi:hypothetical protein